MPRTFGISMMAALAVVVIAAVLSVIYGSTVIPLADVLRALAHGLGFGDATSDGPVARIVLDLRLPRALLAIAVGAGLGVVGLLLQTISRNDLADPFLFGLSAGAAAGAVTVITRFGDSFGVWTLPAAAFAGGMIATAVVLILLRRAEGHGPERLILAGLAVSFLFTALTNYLVFSGDQRAAHSVLFWTMGGLGLASWNNIGIGVVGAVVVLCFSLLMHRKLDAVLAGERTAESLGVSVWRLRVITFVVASFATALLVSVAGVIGFVGLMVPHLARGLAGALHLRLAMMSATLGAALLLASDLAARTLLPAQELPVGVITNSLGAAFVIIVLLSGRSRR